MIRFTRADAKRSRPVSAEELIEKRRAGQLRWHENLSDEERAELNRKREAGVQRYREGQARLKAQRAK